MDMSKYKPLFLSETGEHLNAMEGDLVHLERQPDDYERIHEVFRHLHSIKSMSASMDFEPLSQLAHRLEDLVSPHREANTPVDEGEVDLLLRGVDELRSRLQAAADDLPIPEPPEEFIRAVSDLIKKGGKGRGKSSASTGAPARPDDDPPPVEGEEWTFRVEIVVAADCRLPAVRAFVAYKRLAEIGRVARAEPDIEQVRAGNLPGGSLVMYLRTGRQADDIRRLTETLPELDRVEISAVPAGAEDGAQTVPARKAASPEPEQPPAAGSSPATVRVRSELLDFFVNSVGELITLRSYFEELSERLDVPALRDGVRRMGSVVRKLQDRVMEVRMVPVSMLTGRLPRVCRDLARSRGKRMDFTVEGEGVELDRSLIEALDNPLLHLLRNAVEHGIEPPEERRASGKPEDGTVRLQVQRQHDRILLRLSDDGRGIDPKRVVDKARRAGLISDDQQLSVQEELDLIFQPGLSTRDGVSDLSGRGVGLDVVRYALENLSGRVSVESEPGRGTTFTLDLPLTLAILQILLVQTGGHLLALPASRVLRAMAIREDQIVSDDGLSHVSLAGKRYPLIALDRLLYATSASPPRPDTTITPPAFAGEVILVGSREQPELALGVERVTGHRETVLKTVGRLLRDVGPYNASTVLGDGRPVLILDVDSLIERAAALKRED